MNIYLSACLILLVVMHVVFMRIAVRKTDLDWAVFAKLAYWAYVALVALNLNHFNNNYAVGVVVGLLIWIYCDMQNTIYDIEDVIYDAQQKEKNL